MFVWAVWGHYFGSFILFSVSGWNLQCKHRKRWCQPLFKMPAWALQRGHRCSVDSCLPEMPAGDSPSNPRSLQQSELPDLCLYIKLNDFKVWCVILSSNVLALLGFDKSPQVVHDSSIFSGFAVYTTSVSFSVAPPSARNFLAVPATIYFRNSHMHVPCYSGHTSPDVFLCIFMLWHCGII